MTKEEYLSAKNEYYNKLAEITNSFEKAKQEYINTCGVKVGDIGTLKENDEKVKIAKVGISWKGDIIIELVYKKTKDGEFSKKYEHPCGGTIVNGTFYDWI